MGGKTSTPTLSGKESVELMKLTLAEFVSAFSIRENRLVNELQLNIDFGGRKFKLLLTENIELPKEAQNED